MDTTTIVKVLATELKVGMNFHGLRMHSVVVDPRPRGGVNVQMTDAFGSFNITKRFGKKELVSIIVPVVA